MLRALWTDRVFQRQFAVYLVIGVLVFLVDLTIFQMCVRRGIPIAVTSTIAYFSGTATHFLLNRYVNFRQFDRAIHDQFRTFVFLIFVQWLLTLAIISPLVGHGVAPVIARIAAVIVNLPFGFLANRYLTFGTGILPRLLGLRKAK